MRKFSYLTFFVISICASVASANFYATVGAGATMGSVITRLTYPIDSSTPTEATYNYALAAFTPRISLGYQGQFNKHWGVDTLISLESNIGSASNTVNNWWTPTSANANAKITLPLVSALDILATYQLNDMTSLFLGPGVALAQFNSKSDKAETGGVIGNSTSYSSNVVGGQLMAGVDLLLNPRFKFRLSDEVTFYQPISTTWIEPLSEQPMSGRYNLATNTVMAEVLFNF